MHPGKTRCEGLRAPVPSVQRARISLVALVHAQAVAEYLSFHRAATALGTSQSSVSERIKALEEDLGVVLFERNTRGVRVTEIGRRFINQVDQAIDILDRAVKTASMQARGENSTIRIGVHALASDCFLDKLLKRYQTAHPDMRLHVAEGTARDAQIMVRENRLDIAFMAGIHEIPDLNSRVIWRDNLMVGLPAQHPLTTQVSVEWRQLAEEIFLVRHGGTGPQVHDLIVMRSFGKWPTPSIRRIDVGRSALLSMIAAGHGISLFAEDSTVSNTANVAFMPIRDEPEEVPFSAVWSPRNRDPAMFKLVALATRLGGSRLKPNSR